MSWHPAPAPAENPADKNSQDYWGFPSEHLLALLPPHLKLDVTWVLEGGVLIDGVCLACAGRVARLTDEYGRVIAPRLEGVSRYAIQFTHEPKRLRASVRAAIADLTETHLECGAHKLEPAFFDDELLDLHEYLCLRARATLRDGHALASTLTVLFETEQEQPVEREWSLDGLPISQGENLADSMTLVSAYMEVASRVRQDCQAQPYPVKGAVALLSERRYAFPHWGATSPHGQGFLSVMLSSDFALADIFTGISTSGTEADTGWAQSVVPAPLLRSLFAGVPVAFRRGEPRWSVRWYPAVRR